MPESPEKVKPPPEPAEEPVRHRQAPMPWLKLWTELISCPKFWRVTESMRARYIILLIVACKFDRDGLLPAVEDLAIYLRLDEEETAKTLQELTRVCLVDARGKRYGIHDWIDWQCSRSPAAVKQKRYRDKRNALRNALPDSDVTDESRVVTPRARESQSQSQRKEKTALLGSPALPERPPRVAGRTTSAKQERPVDEERREIEERARRNGPA